MTDRSRYDRPRQGLSLVEVIVSLGVFGILLVSLGLVVNAGYEQYWTASGSLEVQRAALTGTELLVKDLTQSNMDSVEISDPNQRPTPSVPVFDTIMFAAAQDVNGERHYSAKGLLEWQSILGYYSTTSDGVTSLIRNQMPAPTPGTAVPVPSVQGVSLAALAARPARQVVLRGLGNFDLVQKEDLIAIELMGVFQQRGVFTITIRNQAFPRN